MRLYRNLFEGRGWSPERLNALTPKQLLGIAGEGGKGSSLDRKFRSTNEAIAALEAKKVARVGEA